MTTRAPPRPGAPAAPAALSGSVPAPCPLRTPAVPSILFACQSVRINTALILDETRVECFVGPSARGGVPADAPPRGGAQGDPVSRGAGVGGCPAPAAASPTPPVPGAVPAAETPFPPPEAFAWHPSLCRPFVSTPALGACPDARSCCAHWQLALWGRVSEGGPLSWRAPEPWWEKWGLQEGGGEQGRTAASARGGAGRGPDRAGAARTPLPNAHDPSPTRGWERAATSHPARTRLREQPPELPRA